MVSRQLLANDQAQWWYQGPPLLPVQDSLISLCWISLLGQSICSLSCSAVWGSSYFPFLSSPSSFDRCQTCTAEWRRSLPTLILFHSISHLISCTSSAISASASQRTWTDTRTQPPFNLLTFPASLICSARHELIHTLFHVTLRKTQKLYIVTECIPGKTKVELGVTSSLGLSILLLSPI
jgi:hypothetical protein